MPAELERRSDPQTPEDELELLFPGSRLEHLLTIRTTDGLAVAVEALRAVCASGGDLEAMHLTTRGRGRDTVLRLVGLRPREARSLCDCLAALPGVGHAAVEHQLLTTAES